jgi:glycosyltransferase involved in cell wall biosynthesis
MRAMPITLIEAYATGCIPVCTPVGGIPEMVEELDPSILAKSTDEEDYYEALKQIYEIPSDKQKVLKERAKGLFQEKYSMEHCAEKYLELYKKLISSN